MPNIPHPYERVRQALNELADALRDWERSTGIKSVVIFRDDFGVVFRAVNGNPEVPDDVTDNDLLRIVKEKGA